MKNKGDFNPNKKPVKSGGLSKSDIKTLEDNGWKHEKTKYDIVGADVGFKDKKIPTGFIIYKVNVPKGTKYMYNSKDGSAIILDCGNPTCWRHLL